MNRGVLMWKAKDGYLEISLAVVFAIALSYFAYTIYNQGESSQFLEHARARLLISEAKQKRAIENKLDEEGYGQVKATFSQALQNADFKMTSLQKVGNKFIAIVTCEADFDSAKARLKNSLENVQFVGDDQVHWFFEETAVRKKYALDGICFFSNNDWQVWIDGKMYDQDNKQIDEKFCIKQVDEFKVVIEKAEEGIVILEL